MAERTKLIKKLDKIFSIWVRRKDSVDEEASCFTCGCRRNFKEIHAGHFMSRKYMATRWSELNVQPQCIKCNIFDNGQQYLFAKNLDKKFGDGTANELHLKSQMLTKFTNDELLEKIRLYTKLVKEL